MYIIGIDEVGRGSLAGPVVVAVVALPKKWHAFRLRDSKKLTPRSREEFFKYAKDSPTIFYAVSRVYQRNIDKINISKSADLAATRAFLKLVEREKILCRKNVYLDGGLYMYASMLRAAGLRLSPRTIIKGDEKINAIKFASIVAKVTRDRYMVKLHKLYPKYGFDIHRGTGQNRIGEPSAGMVSRMCIGKSLCN